MGHDVFLEVGQHFNLFEEKRHFSGNDALTYFSNKNNKPKMIHFEVWDESTQQNKSHIAHVSFIDYKNSRVYYSLPIAGNNYINMSDVFDVWE